MLKLVRPFYGLGMNSPKIITNIWYGAKGSPPDSVYSLLVHNVWQSLIIVCIGAISGCLVTFVAIDKLGRRNIQMIGFFWLFILFVVVGGSFHHLYLTGGSSAVIVLYILCQIFFNFGKFSYFTTLAFTNLSTRGPNTTTYIVCSPVSPNFDIVSDIFCSFQPSFFQHDTAVFATEYPQHLGN
jgi:hypothetical protein